MLLGGFLLLAFFWAPAEAASPFDSGTATATPFPAATPTFDMARLDKPQVSDPPSQLDVGALEYWGVCMACHGDKGQGLTDEWRYAAFGEDNNCWVSKCHASNHPPQGFEFPHIVPSLAGPGRLARFVNAEQLYEFNLANMPRWKPGSLTKEKAWAVTAYILKMNSTLPDGVTLGPSNAQFIPVQYKITSPGVEIPWKVLLASTFLLAAIVMSARVLGERQSGRRPNFILHLHPPAIPAMQARWRYTLGAGGLAVFLCLILLATGLLEMFYYIPSPERAAQSVQEIAFLVPYGGLVRNLHFWSAQGLALIATIHLLRVLFTGAYNKPRRFNYLLGMGLLVIILLLDFTGYVLRWDEGIRWALIAGTNLLATVPTIGAQLVTFISGGMEPGPGMLIRYYAWHIFGLATLGGILMIWHLFRVRRDGGIAAPPAHVEFHREEAKDAKNSLGEREGVSQGTQKTRITRYELLRREVLAMLAASGILMLIATFLPAPIAQPMNVALVSLVESRAPWFFLWVQQLLKTGNPFIWGILTPLLLLTFLSALPYLFPRRADDELGRWFPHGGRILQIVAIILTIAIVTLTSLALIK
jgi:quinol-cytochrome oxidoreductase complex cytochrome b subunit/mono/diheme cytochrome c family protein